MGLSPDNELPNTGLKSGEHTQKEAYVLGQRIPIFRLPSAIIKPGDQHCTYEAQFDFDLQRGVLPTLPFSVRLGTPDRDYSPLQFGHFIREAMAKNPEYAKKLEVWGDLDPLLATELIKKVPSNYGATAAFGPHNPSIYRFTDDAMDALTRMRLRIYNGENGKVYEAKPNRNSMHGSNGLDFRRFYEVGEKSITAEDDDIRNSLIFNLQDNQAAYNTNAELILLPK